MSTEHWRDVVGWEGIYSVSDRGRILSYSRIVIRRCGRRLPVREKILRPTVNTRGYHVVTLRGGGRKFWCHVHMLVCQAFHGERPEGMQTRHLDGDKSNNSVANLQYGTPLENAADKTAHGTTVRGSKHVLSKLTKVDVRKIRALVAAGARQVDVAVRFGICQPHVSDVAAGRVWGWLS